jgi:heme o synthase
MSRITTASAIPLTQSNPRARWRERASDYVELTKPRIVALELVTIIVAAQLAAPWGIDRWVLVHTVLGAALVAASAGAINQWWERATDARMKRTARRPLPAGRLLSWQVVLFGAATLGAGILELALGVGLATAAVALATWLVYVFAYTPLKTRSPLNTAVGAVSGALSLVAVMFLWQFPHFMAIAWLHRADYARAGQRMLTVVDPTGLRAGAQALVAALVLVPVSLVPALSPQSGSAAVYCLWAVLLGAGQVAAALFFMIHRDDISARRLLRASLVYLPCWMGLLLIIAV